MALALDGEHSLSGGLGLCFGYLMAVTHSWLLSSSCWLQINWKIPEELRRELAELSSLQLYARQMYMSSIDYIL